MAATLHLKRGGGWVDSIRRYRIEVDGNVVGNIGRNEEQVISVAPGSHRLRLCIDWCSSNTLDVAVSDGDSRWLSCGTNATLLLGLVFAIFFRSRYLWLAEARDA